VALHPLVAFVRDRYAAVAAGALAVLGAEDLAGLLEHEAVEALAGIAGATDAVRTIVADLRGVVGERDALVAIAVAVAVAVAVTVTVTVTVAIAIAVAVTIAIAVAIAVAGITVAVAGITIAVTITVTGIAIAIAGGRRFGLGLCRGAVIGAAEDGQAQRQR
jgi:hypothetical protein